MRTSVMPAATASSTTYWIAGLSTRVSISFGVALVAGRNRVPRPAAGMTALRTGMQRVLPPVGTARGAVLLALVERECQRRGGRVVPTYEYACRECGQHLEVQQSFSDQPLTECPACNGPLR